MNILLWVLQVLAGGGLSGAWPALSLSVTGNVGADEIHPDSIPDFPRRGGSVGRGRTDPARHHAHSAMVDSLCSWRIDDCDDRRHDSSHQPRRNQLRDHDGDPVRRDRVRRLYALEGEADPAATIRDRSPGRSPRQAEAGTRRRSLAFHARPSATERSATRSQAGLGDEICPRPRTAAAIARHHRS